ncbi:MAG: DHA2 family efflux MFS transporter permease subunit [Proteobacteria bacterium]|nr:DHA2 family efflux MFS transporter permease subunit [Pseudomonadota bacterium]
MITLFIMLATIMQVLDTTIANVALPHMQGSLSATQDQITWVLTSYIVAAAVMTPPTGWLAGRFGRKKIFLTAIAGFTLTSVLCGLATSIEEMVAFRLLQGVFGASLVPLSQSTLLDINPKERHGAAMAMWGVGIMLGPILGPTLGGYLTEYYNWRWVFYINLPVGIISFIGCSAFLPETDLEKRPFDRFGFAMLALSIATLQLILDRGEQVDWFTAKELLVYTGVGLSAFWMYVVHSRTAAHPFLSPELFVDRNFVTGLVFIFFVGIILLATMALLPPYLQNLMGYPVVDVGLLMAPRGGGTMVAMMIVGKLSGKVDARKLIFLGLVLIVISLWEMARFSTFVPTHLIVQTGIIQGLGLGFIFVPLSTIAFATLAPKLRTEATSLFSLVRNLGSSIGVSLVTTLLSSSMQTNHAYLSEHITPYNTALIQSAMPQSIGSGGMSTVLMAVNGEITRQAATIGYLNDFAFMMWVVLAIMPMVLLLQNPHKRKQPSTEESIELALE